ncbi:hypothetical protein L915_00628 [Phytophthora nicotianae]|uniref:SCP domain-containing protein n=2 Tax=Phytophthora nicotianae TaxID=4792 RepID=W2RFG6_PHYN3|nr:hypothetical protein PPTG_00571 [Phytophthora nicotianae INRA-310]ETK96710.1 hypothetical protein L915_00628 [Phytophthora nicotianae]ETN24132.1 hypothetical protein PPTG_00571 [Phytophthora nicotianae INRA-310]KUF83086.1 hypothetical protein AM587_10006234 [Phytophthora nicotianae]
MQPNNYLASMLERVNQERATKNLPPLRMHSKLQAAAQRQADDMAANNFMGHTGSDGSKMTQRAADAGFSGGAVAENVAAGQKDVNAVVESWMKSPGHRRNILGNYTVFGAAYAFNRSSRYKHSWSQMFGRGGNDDIDDENEIPWTSTGHDFSPESTDENSTSDSDSIRQQRHDEGRTVREVTCTGCWCFGARLKILGF